MSVRSTYGSFQSTWLSKSQPYVKPADSARRASDATRSSGWSGFSVKPNSMRRGIMSAVPLGNVLHPDANDGCVAQRHAAVLGVSPREHAQGMAVVFTFGEDVRDPVHAHPGALRPV